MQTLGWKSLLERRRFHSGSLVFKSFNNLVDFNFNEICIGQNFIIITLDRELHDLYIPVYRTNWGRSRSDFIFIDEFNNKTA